MNKTREEKIVNNLNLIYKVINDKITYNANYYEDLFQVGCIGLIKAVDLFDESKNIKFSTYAYKLIYTEIITYLKLSQNKNISLNTTMIKTVNNENNDITLLDSVEDKKCNIEEEYLDLEEKIIINKLIKKVKMSDKCKFIVLLYYGFYNNKKYTRKDLANIFNVSQTYVGIVINKFIKEMEKQIRIEYGRDLVFNRSKHKKHTRR